MNQKNDFGRFDFVGKIGIFGGLSLIFVIISLGFLAIRGINYGIDFSGGTEMEVKFQSQVPIVELRKTVDTLNLPGADIQAFEGGAQYVIRFQTHEGKTEKETNDLQSQSVEAVRGAVTSAFQAQQPEILRVDSVGPQVGAELKRNGALAVFYCLLVILIYIALRFDYKYAPGAVLCLAHDAIIALALFVATGREVNVPILAAILTLIGYSLNDTIVVLDRIRETEGEHQHRGSKFVINRAINDMLERTIITAGSTLTAAICLWAIAGGTVSDIGFALTIGIAFGTYSSIYVAAPFIIIVEKLQAARAQKA